MPERHLIDTNIAIYLAKEHRNLQPYRAELEGNILALGFVNAAELLLTARRATHPEAALDYWREHLPHYVILIPDLEACDIWARVAAQCYAKSQSLLSSVPSAAPEGPGPAAQTPPDRADSVARRP
jgi:predicted nucleic acid-binding protein